MSALLAHLERILIRVHLRHPKAEIIDLQDMLANRALRQRQARLVERDLLFGPPNEPPEPPGAA